MLATSQDAPNRSTAQMTDNTAVDRMGSLFQDFLAAAEAIKERPQLIAKVQDAEAQRDRAEAEARFANERRREEQLRSDELRAKVAQLEADLAQATFREKAARESMELVLGALKETVNTAKAAVELVEPPAPSVIEQPPAEVIIAAPFPYQAPPIDEPPTTNYDGSSAGTVEASPSGTVMDVPPAPVEPTAYKPYLDKPYWLKPDNTSWRDWTNGGGDRAPWVKDTDAEWTETYHRGGLSDVG